MKRNGWYRWFLLLFLFPVCALAAEAPARVDAALVQAFLPEYGFEEGIQDAEGNVLRLLMRRPDGALVFVGGVQNETGWQWTESRPLPEDAHIGYANFADSIAMNGNGTLVRVSPFADGTWGVTLMYTEKGNMFPLGQNWIDNAMNDEPLGDHPWRDISVVDWMALPADIEEAVSQLDPSRWARVLVPEVTGKLSLHVTPDESSAVLGTYYRGAPVRILESGTEWTKVDLLGMEGWMKTTGLAIGEAMNQADYRGPWLSARGDGIMVHDQPLADSPCRFVQDHSWNAAFYVIGEYNEEWLHVWCVYEGTGGYVRRNDLWEGNG